VPIRAGAAQGNGALRRHAGGELGGQQQQHSEVFVDLGCLGEPVLAVAQRGDAVVAPSGGVMHPAEEQVIRWDQIRTCRNEPLLQRQRVFGRAACPQQCPLARRSLRQ